MSMRSVIVRPSMREIRVYTTGARRRALLQAVEQYEDARRSGRRRIERVERARAVGGLMNSYRYAVSSPAVDTPDVILGSDLLAWYPRGTGIYDSLVGGSLVTSNNQEVGRWEDSSGNGYHMVRAASIGFGHTQYRTSEQYLGVSTINFSTPGFTLPSALGTALNSAGQGEIWIVLGNPTSDSQFGGGLMNFSASDFESWWTYSDGHIYEGWGSTVRKSYGVPAVTMGTAFHRYNVWSAPNDHAAYLDTVAQGSSGSNTVTFRTSGLQFGINAPSGAGWTGHISEIIVAKVKASSGQRAAMDTYLTT